MKKINTYKHSGTKVNAVSEREKRSAEIARRAAAESMVLLKNEGLLPLRKGMHLALFGSGAQFTVKGGTGSGDVNPRKTVNVLEGLLNKGFDIVNADWIKDYETRYHNARQAWKELILGDGSEEAKANFFFTYTDNPFYMPDGRPVADMDVNGADAAVYVISRNAGENTDYSATNKLLGSTTAIDALPTGSFILYNNAFVVAEGTNLAANRCYLPANFAAGASARRLTITIGGGNEGTTGVNELKHELSVDETWYDLNGRKLDGMPRKRGVYIMNGKKVVIK